MQIVPATTTRMEPADAVRGLLAAAPDMDRESAALFLALIWIETGGGRAVQHNVGNLTASSRFQGAAWRPPWFEVGPDSSDRMKRLHALMLEGKAPSAFRAYPTFEAGFRDFVSLVQSPPFASLASAAKTGDPTRFRLALAERYSKDYTAAHDATLASLRRKFAPLVISQPPPKTEQSPGNSGGLMLVALAAKLLGALS